GRATRRTNGAWVSPRASPWAPGSRYASRYTGSTCASYSARSAAPSPARTLAISSRSSTGLRSGGDGQPSDTARDGRVALDGCGRVGGGSLFKEESHPEARQQRQEEGSERADQEVFGELSV